jgi:hypothetical protein
MTRLLFRSFLVFAVVCSSISCSNKSTTSKSLPPGQQKKIFGSQSASPYAPGQTKKQSGSASKSNTNVPPGQAKKKANAGSN